MSSLIHHVERLAGIDPRLHKLVETWVAELTFDVLVLEGVRTKATVAANWAKGRVQLPDGSWMVSDPKAIVTHAQNPADSPHCYAAAIDCMPLLNGAVVWDQQATEWPLCLERLHAMAGIAKRLGLVWGGDFASLKDLDHFEVVGWRALPLVAT